MEKSNIFSNNKEFNKDGVIEFNINNIIDSMLESLSNSKFKDYFIIKGGSALMLSLKEENESSFIRETTDIDIHCESKDIWYKFVNDCEDLFNNNKNGFIFKLVKERKLTEETSSSSLKFNVTNHKNESCTVKVDMNIKSNDVIGYEKFNSIDLNHFDYYTMLSDKIVVCCSHKIFRRIKDLYDLYAITKTNNVKLIELAKRIKIKHNTDKLEIFINEYTYKDLEHAYNKYKGFPINRNFDELYIYVVNFLKPFIEYYNKYEFLIDYEWDSNLCCWRGRHMNYLQASLEGYKNMKGKGVIGVECASGYWGMSTFPTNCLVFLSDKISKDSNGVISFVKVDKITLDNTVEIADGLYVTDKERTICDMIKYGCEVRFLLESIEDYCTDDDNKELTKLKDMLMKENLWEKYLEYKEEVKDFFEY